MREFYNKREIKIGTIECHTYHSFSVKYYSSTCFTDYQMTDIIDNQMVCKCPYLFDLLILDEAQDMTSLYYALVCKIIKDQNALHVKLNIPTNYIPPKERVY